MSLAVIDPTQFSWTPAALGAEGWYDAADKTTIAESGGAVSQWDDKSGNDRHLAQSVAAAKPTTGSRLLGGLNVLDGDGSEFMFYAGFPVRADGDISIFAVCVIDSVANFSDGIYAMDGAGADFKFSAGPPGDVSGDFNGFVQGGFGTNLILTGGPFPGPSIYNAEFDKTGSGLVTARIDGTSHKTETYATNLSSPMRLAVLADKGELFPIDGAVAEVIIVRDMSLATRQKIEGYLAWKWGGA